MILRNLLLLLIFGAGVSCTWPETANTESKDIVLANSEPLPQSTSLLSKEIFILIGRGSCCNGHVISVTKDGKVIYLVGTYHMANAASNGARIPDYEKFDLNQVTVNTRYAQRNVSLPRDVTDRLSKIVQDPDRLHHQDKRTIHDAYHLSVYVDNRLVASGFRTPEGDYPDELKELINLVLSQVELYDLGGMA